MRRALALSAASSTPPATKDRCRDQRRALRLVEETSAIVTETSGAVPKTIDTREAPELADRRRDEDLRGTGREQACEQERPGRREVEAARR